MNTITRFGIIGGGFRASFYLRIALMLPEQFTVCGVVVRNDEKRREIARTWGVPVYGSLNELLSQEKPQFVVVSVSRPAAPGFLRQLAEKAVPALVETPPAPDLAGLQELQSLTDQGARIQVAEQYSYQPMHAAVLSAVDSGMLGTVTQTTVSVSHAYHGIHVMRRMLGVGFRQVKIRAMRFNSPVIDGPDRSGPPTSEVLVTYPRDCAWLDFGDALGIYDFTKNQHRSWIRSNHLCVRGTRGEIFDSHMSILQDFSTPLYMDFQRITAGEGGNLEGHYLKGISVGERYLYTNPFVPARLYDDEIAIAHCLQNMSRYADGGPSFYGLDEASQDHYLGLLIEEAIQTGQSVCSEDQPWIPAKKKPAAEQPARLN